MHKGKIGGMFGETGQVLSEGKTYNFNINVLNGMITNGTSVEFELDGSKVKAIYAVGAKKVSVPVEPKVEPVVEPVVEPKVEPKPRESISKRMIDNRDFLTEEK
tara:strand:+ start:37 stop:348 length:312 start_codon:yes stop_codon:yes gene_type:complete